jgi:hypothetical protein
MSAFEVFVCRAALREVLHGFTFPDFEPRMGCTRQEAARVNDSLPRPPVAEVNRTAPPRHKPT